MAIIPENADDFNKLLMKLEIPLWVLTIAGFILTATQMQYAHLVMIITLALLGIVYFLTSVIREKQSKFLDGIGDRIAGVGKGCVFYGIISILINDPDATTSMLIAIGCMVASIVIHIAKKLPTRELTRPFLILTLGVVFNFIPKDQLDKYHMIDHSHDVVTTNK